MTDTPAQSGNQSPGHPATDRGPDPLPVDRSDIDAAAERLAGNVVRTPLLPAYRLGQRFGVSLSMKAETFQFTGSFKDRGAFNRLSGLTPDEAKRGVVAMSAGNHAQGVAYHAQRLGIPATIVMPRTTPFTKIERTEAFGATVLLQGQSVSDAYAHTVELAERDGLTIIHPYDDPLVIAGQGTIGLEMLADQPDLDTLVVPIGGGGLMAGIAIAARSIKPDIRIIGVEAALYPSMRQSLDGEPVTCSGVTIAEGIAVKSPGKLTRQVIEALVDDVILVSEASLEDAVQSLLMTEKLLVEGAGAAGVAALVEHPELFQPGSHVGTVLCGANIDARLLSSVLMRGLARSGHLVRLRVIISDEPGILGHVAQLVGQMGANIVEVYHHRLFHDVPVKMAEIDVVVETKGSAHVERLVTSLNEEGYSVELMSEIP